MKFSKNPATETANLESFSIVYSAALASRTDWHKSERIAQKIQLHAT